MLSPGVFGVPLEYMTTGAVAIAAADLDGDGRVDLVCALRVEASPAATA